MTTGPVGVPVTAARGAVVVVLVEDVQPEPRIAAASVTIQDKAFIRAPVVVRGR
jgi:hypothetical protein